MQRQQQQRLKAQCSCHLVNPVTNRVVRNTAKNRASIEHQIAKHINMKQFPDWKNKVSQCDWQFSATNDKGFSESRCVLEDKLAVDGNKTEIVLKKYRDNAPNTCSMSQQVERGWGAGSSEDVWVHQMDC